MNYLKQKKNFIRAVSLLSVLSIVFSVSTAVYASRAHKYKLASEIVYERALNELCESLDNITVSLQKGVCCSTGKMLSAIGNDLTREASCAKISLGQLPVESAAGEQIYKFLSQIGAFTLSAVKGQNRLSLSKEQRESLSELLAYSCSLSEGLDKIRAGSLNGDIVNELSKSTLTLSEAEYPVSFSQSVTDAQQSLEDYPTLIYDGPFADSILNKKGGEALKGLDEITKDEAKKIAAELLGQTPEGLREYSDTTVSGIELFCFGAGDSGIALTKKGGKLYYMLRQRAVGEETISSEEGIKRAKKFLKEIGYDSLKESYYSVFDGVCTVNFAYVKNGIIHYSDLIKVSVALDTGEILSSEAGGYLVNHEERDIYEEKITLSQAEAVISDGLEILSVKSAVIPLETGKEAYCYEFRCKYGDSQEVLVYIDKATGEERDILLLLYSDGGVLTK